MQPIIPPVPVSLLKEELARVRFVRPTCKAGNLIYDFTAAEAPNLMREVGRLRELAFRQGGGGTGLELDVDRFDFSERPYHQLIVWDPDNKAIVGGYRWIDCREAGIGADGQPELTSSHLFRYSPEFVSRYMDCTLELGRAFVQPAYQTREMGSRSLFALDNLWDGLGSIVYTRPHLRFFLGKVTIYPSFDAPSRNLLYAYLERFNVGTDAPLAWAKLPVEITPEARTEAKLLFTASSPEENFKILQNAVRQRDAVIPPLFTAYLHLCPTLRSFGNAVNEEFGNVYETGILVPVADIDPAKYERHIASHGVYLDQLNESSL